jgi:hypothetical protein
LNFFLSFRHFKTHYQAYRILCVEILHDMILVHQVSNKLQYRIFQHELGSLYQYLRDKERCFSADIQILTTGCFLYTQTFSVYFYSFIIISPMRRGLLFVFYNSESSLPKHDLCQLWLKLIHWFSCSGDKVENVLLIELEFSSCKEWMICIKFWFKFVDFKRFFTQYKHL